jgi:hypothetical protein
LADYEPGWGKNTLRILPNNLHKLDLRGGKSKGGHEQFEGESRKMAVYE